MAHKDKKFSLKKVRRRVGAANGGRTKAAPNSPDLQAYVASLEARVQRAEEAFDINSAVFADSFKMVEVQLNVLRRVLDEFYAKLVSDGGGIDFNDYLKKELERLTASEAEAKKEQSAPTESPIIQAPDADAPVIFGGDTL